VIGCSGRSVQRHARAAAAVLALAGTALLAWVGLTLMWGEPFTALTTREAQSSLRHELADQAEAWSHREGLTLQDAALDFQATLAGGDPFGEIAVPRLGLRMVVVEGTTRGDLARGPGHYPTTSLPGLGGTIGIAGHRTTHLQPFRHLDALEAGDVVSLEMPYGTFQYVVYRRAIVDDQDRTILRRRPFEMLVLSACHPLYPASQRIVVFARLRDR
jgi:sortase A